MHSARALILIIASLLLAAPATAQGPAPVTIAQVLEAFDEICVRQAPDFRDSEVLMARHGLNTVAESGTVYHPSGVMSVKVQIVRRGESTERLRCSLVYEVPDGRGASAGMDLIADRLGRDAWDRRRTRSQSGRDVIAWRISAFGRDGDMFHIPYSDPKNLGVMTIQF